MSGYFDGSVRPVQPSDASALRRILKHWLGPDAEQTLSRVLADDGEVYVVAVEQDELVGVMGLEFDGIRPPLFGPADEPASLISAYIDPHHRSRRIGSALADHLEGVALARSCTRLVVVSGARTRDSYRFWTSRYGDIVFYEAHAFGPGAERVAWSVPLPREKG
jgi:GNAT superfamily N-acetyltransferase